MVLEQTLLKQECLVCLGVFSKIFIYLFYYLFLAVLGLLSVYGLSLVVASGGYSPGVVHRLLVVVASLVAQHGLWGT